MENEYKIMSVDDLTPYIKAIQTKSLIKNGSKICACSDCGIRFEVRKDTTPVVCRACASSRGGKGKKGKTKAEMVSCLTCDKKIRVSLNQTYCSLTCRQENNRIQKTCKKCNKRFTTLKSSTNVGNFCSRPCYEKWLCNTERTTGRGSQWNRIRKSVLSKFPFCAVCGKTKNLQVHHIIPFRLTKDNSERNLIPLCITHHKKIEFMFVGTENAGVDKTNKVFWYNELRFIQRMTIQKIKGVIVNAA